MLTPGLARLERPAVEQAAGVLVLLHGRGGVEEDLLPVGELLDPERRLDAVALRGPLGLPGGRFEWVEPGPRAARTLTIVAQAVDELVAGYGWERSVLAGYSQGGMVSYALALRAGRPRPAGLVALAASLPPFPGAPLDLAPPLPAIAIAHGVLDDVVPVSAGRAARDRLLRAGASVDYHELAAGHLLSAGDLAPLRGWAARLLT